ncbi:hypothetical protein SAMN05443244_0085 [Terriglobus roseus]|uniref:Uncharacterized protein n=2 Tax=Terriglobus roseus TaxID=392734 RepID=A0A1H4IUE1_9BACT|nr:hypothetical protein SAMN05443244_0085 [Terriglobus roseus]
MTALELESNAEVDAPTSDARWSLVERILATNAFQRSPRLSEFLRHATEMTLAGNEDQLSEQRVGTRVFGRAEDYDCSADTVVRSSALRLRRQLELYFQRDGSSEPVVLTLPRGGYRVVFESRPMVVPVSPDADPSAPPETALDPTEMRAPIAPEVTAGSSVRTSRALLSLTILLLLAFAVESYLLLTKKPSRVTPPTSVLWSVLFTANHPTRIVLGDSGLVLFHAVTHRYLSLADYVAHRYDVPSEARDPDFARFLSQRRYTSIVDADALARFARLPEASPDRTFVKFARDMRLEDLKDGNVILLGAQEADPWVEMFERSMDFQFVGPTKDADAHFTDRRAASGRPQMYSTTGGRVFAVVAFLPNLNNSGNVLLLEGLNMTGTESALDFILEKERIEPLLKKLRKPDGTLPYFEILIECRAVTDEATPAEVIQVRLHPH